MADRSVRTILTNMCMITDGSKVLVEEKILADGQTGIMAGLWNEKIVE